jgi:ADP-ribose pyrophosphatase
MDTQLKRGAALIIYKGKKFSLEKRTKVLPNGSRMDVEALKVSGGITILPINHKKIVLVKEYRPVIGRWIYELPAGGIKSGESSMECARRELKEETGFAAKRFSYMFTSFPTPGMSTEKMHFFMASGLKKGMQELERHELIKIREFTPKRALKMVQDGSIIDGKTIQGILYYSCFVG